MLRRIVILLTLAVASATLVSAAEVGLSVSLSIEPSNVLVGLSPSIRLDVTNVGAVPTALPKYLIVRVTPDGGSSFIAINGFSGERLATPLNRKTLGPGEEVALEYRTRSIGSRPPWFWDPHWLEPGTYRIQAVLTDDARGVSSEDVTNLESVLAVRGTSREAILTVVAPDGDDAIVWNALKSALQPRTNALDPFDWSERTLSELATKYVQSYPSSAYTPYLAGSVRADSRVDRLHILERAIAAQPQNAMADEVWQQVTYDEMQLAAAAELAKDLPTAIRWNGVARQHLERLSKSVNTDVKEWSTKKLGELPTPTALQQRMSEE